MDLAIDARWMVGNLRGMGRYAHSLIEPVKSHVLSFLPQGYPVSSTNTVSHGKGFFPYWEQVELPRLCNRYKIKNLICPYNTAPLVLPNTTKLILVVHDLIYLEPWRRLPPSVSPYQTLGRMYRRAIVPKVIDRADMIITVSNYTRDQIIEKFNISRERIVVIPNSINSSWFVSEPLAASERSSYILAVAGEAPSKNLGRLIAAMGVWRGKYDNRFIPELRVVGIKQAHHSSFARVASDAGVQDLLKFEGFVSDEELKNLYRNAGLFVMPSLYEGFGIPLLEAMASGTPVACSNTTSLPEVVGDAALLFNPREVEDIASKLEIAWGDCALRQKLADQGISRAHQYTSDTVTSAIARFWTTL